MPTTIPLGDAPSVTALFSYPNIPGSTETLQQTVLHWCKQILVSLQDATGLCNKQSQNPCIAT